MFCIACQIFLISTILLATRTMVSKWISPFDLMVCRVSSRYTCYEGSLSGVGMNKDYEKTFEFTPVYQMMHQDAEGSKTSYTAYMLNFVQVHT